MTGLVLCGGEGKRLQGVIPFGMPKCLIEVGGLPIWRYVEMAAFAAGCRDVHIAAGPYAADFVRCGRWVVEEQGREGTTQVVSRCPDRPLAVFNGDTLLFGQFEIPEASGLLRVLGRNRVTGGSGESVFRVVGPEAGLSGSRNVEDLNPTMVVDLSSTLAFIDVGTPQGLAHALAEARKWS